MSFCISFTYFDKDKNKEVTIDIRTHADNVYDAEDLSMCLSMENYKDNVWFDQDGKEAA